MKHAASAISPRFDSRRDVANAEDARCVIKIGTWYNSADETLRNLDMTLNRMAGQRGFVVA